VSIIPPGKTIGILGSGQLGRMLAIEARKMGYRVETFSPEANSPAAQVSDKDHVADYTDVTAVRAFASGVDVVTFEFENVPSLTAEVAAEFAPVRPRGEVLHIAQHRLREKTFLSEHGIPVAPFRHVRTESDLRIALSEIGYPAILKSAGFGYDGKGQSRIVEEQDVARVLPSLRHGDAVLEGFVDFEMEISVVATRGLDGTVAHFGVCENLHKNHILDITIAPGRVSPEVAEKAVALATQIVEVLDVVGVLCTEMFVTRDGSLIVNELAPRPHNSGHFTFDASMTSQFGQQLRAVTGMPLGSTEQLRPAVMVQLLGDLWAHGEPNWARAVAIPGVHLHLYGKTQARAGRKMGHITAMAATLEEAYHNAIKARERLLD
jgi:5-(carboxyamino)imidazole ribonucleotide synthase